MLRKISLLTLIIVLSLVFAIPAFAGAPPATPPPTTSIYVTSQGRIYKSIVLGSLPFNGQENFQKLEMGGPTGLQTEFGPGDTGYFGGRWWVDNGLVEGEMDEEDTFFLCPLLGPGYESGS